VEKFRNQIKVKKKNLIFLFLGTPLYSPVEDTFRPRNENTKNSNYYPPEENYSSPTVKSKGGNTGVPKSQRNFYEENTNSSNTNNLKPNSKPTNTNASEPKINSKKKY
jgi:hypothetical protein